jgi:hypothetical protein
MKHVILDIRTPEAAVAKLVGLGFEPILLPPFPALAEPVAAHPDMLIFLGRKLYCHADYLPLARRELERIAEVAGLELETTNEPIGNEYPLDVLFNAFAVGNMLFGKADSISEKLKTDFESIINLRQGYAKCSTCAVSERAFITADESVKKALLAQGFEVLKISAGGVELKGYDCGFIGGASGSDGERVYFCGSLDLHPDGEEIKAFCASHGRPAVSLSGEPLYDVGTMFFI